MGANAHISKWGASLAIRIPDATAQQWGVSEGSAIELISRGDEIILRKVAYSLEDMLAQVTEDNLHSNSDFGTAQGLELW